jgi:hypothetical protein
VVNCSFVPVMTIFLTYSDYALLPMVALCANQRTWQLVRNSPLHDAPLECTLTTSLRNMIARAKVAT